MTLTALPVLRSLCALLSVAVLTATLAGPAGAGEQPPRQDVSDPAADAALVAGSLIVTTTDVPAADRLPARARRALSERVGISLTASERLDDRIVLLTVPGGRERAAAAVLRAQEGVDAVEPERRYTYAGVPNDPRYDEQWSHTLTGAEHAWGIQKGSPDVRIAVLDSGMLGTHEDLKGNIEAQVEVAGGSAGPARTGIDNATCPEGSQGSNTYIARRHGTWVGGVAGAVGDNAIGVTGAAWRVSMLDVALSSSQDLDSCHLGPSDGAIVRGLRWARDYPGGVDVVNLSLGSLQDQCPSHMQVAIDEVRTTGATVIAAAGNEGEDRPAVPASCRGVIAVGAVSQTGTVALYSNRASYLSLVAPGGAHDCEGGECILTTDRDDGYGIVSGTSFAAPYVAGVAALVRSQRPDLAPDQVQNLLESTAKHPSKDGQRDDDYGWGIVQAGDALQWLADGKSVPRSPDATKPYLRIAFGGPTEPIGQAVAMSRETFPDRSAAHALIARADDYPDALAGSALGYGIGPILFTPRTGNLAAASRDELLRVLPEGGLVYLLGGADALDAQVEDDIRALGRGYQVRRLEGPTREHTAVAVSQETERRLRELGFPHNRSVILATRGNWPDAVTAGSLAATYGVPVLLTEPGRLHEATARELARLAATTLYVVGGTTVISDQTAEAARVAAGAAGIRRLGGPARDHTAVAVAAELNDQLRRSGFTPPSYAIAVNVDRADGFAHVLSASALSGATGSVFIPVRTADGTILTEPARQFACGLGSTAVLAGGGDLVADDVGLVLADLLQGGC